MAAAQSVRVMNPVPASFKNSIQLYKGAWTQYERARRNIEIETQHDDNFDAGHRLTARGVAVIYKLFSMGLVDSDIAELMDMDSSSVYRRRKEWENS